MLTEAQGKYLFTFTLQVFESKPHCVCTGICLRDGVGFTQPTHCICLLLEFIQRRLPILSDLQRARVCVIAAHQEQTIVFGCLLAPSGALIAIPTYYWYTHFFRSHRSSTLDFNFLSHYSYIKAIMLYKGNHWTQCASFMDASWLRLGITNDDMGTSWALPEDNLGMT